MELIEYPLKFLNFRKVFVFINSIKIHICHFKNSRLGHDLSTSVNNRVISQWVYFRETLHTCEVCENKILSKISEFKVLHSRNVHVQLSSVPGGLSFIQSLHLQSKLPEFLLELSVVQIKGS